MNKNIILTQLAQLIEAVKYPEADDITYLKKYVRNSLKEIQGIHKDRIALVRATLTSTDCNSFEEFKDALLEKLELLKSTMAISQKTIEDINPKLIIKTLSRHQLESIVAEVYDILHRRANLVDYLSDKKEWDSATTTAIFDELESVSLGYPTSSFETLDTNIEDLERMTTRSYSREDIIEAIQNILKEFDTIEMPIQDFSFPSDQISDLWLSESIEFLTERLKEAASIFFPDHKETES